MFAQRDRLSANPLDVAQWEFYVSSTRALNEAVGEQKSIRLGPLLAKVKPRRARFDGLRAAVSEAAG